jgi:hypothetical protein
MGDGVVMTSTHSLSNRMRTWNQVLLDVCVGVVVMGTVVAGDLSLQRQDSGPADLGQSISVHTDNQE